MGGTLLTSTYCHYAAGFSAYRKGRSAAHPPPLQDCWGEAGDPGQVLQSQVKRVSLCRIVICENFVILESSRNALRVKRKNF